jgi:hypothetical protein
MDLEEDLDFKEPSCTTDSGAPATPTPPTSPIHTAEQDPLLVIGREMVLVGKQIVGLLGEIRDAIEGSRPARRARSESPRRRAHSRTGQRRHPREDAPTRRTALRSTGRDQMNSQALPEVSYVSMATSGAATSSEQATATAANERPTYNSQGQRCWFSEEQLARTDSTTDGWGPERAETWFIAGKWDVNSILKVLRTRYPRNAWADAYWWSQYLQMKYFSARSSRTRGRGRSRDFGRKRGRADR